MSIRKVLLGILFAAVIGGGLFLGSKYIGFRNTAYLFPENGGAIKIAILDPDTGTEMPAGEFLPVTVMAKGENPLLSVELWANGELVAVQSAPPGGVTPMNVSMSWIPPSPGEYSLLARAMDTDQNTGTSSVVYVSVHEALKEYIENESDDPDTVVPVVQGSGGEGNPPAQVPAPALPTILQEVPEDANVEEARRWNPSPIVWAASLFNTTDPPAAPVILNYELSECDVKLYIQDKIENELGFNLYRQDPGQSSFTLVATRGAHEITDYFFIKDSGLAPGLYQYYAAAFNLGGETPGNIKSIEISTDSCTPPISEQPVLSLNPSAFLTDTNTELFYCYKSLDGLNWSRWPTEGFFTPGVLNPDIESLASIIQTSEEQSTGLHLDCWGWSNGELEWLGELDQDSINLAAPGNLTIQNSGLSLEVEASVDTMKPMDGPPPEPAPVDPQMPEVFAMILYGAEVCKDHTPSAGDNFWENLLFCTPWPGYDVGSQPYLIWWVSDRCLAGKGDACHDADYYRSRAEDTHGEAGFHVFAQFSNVYPVLTTPTSLSAWAIEPPQNGCGTDTKYLNVRMYYTGGPDDPDFPNQTMQGPESNTVNTFPFCPAPEEVELEVQINSISFGDLGDGIGGGDDLEIYGWISAKGAPGTGGARSLRPWGDHGDCPDDNYEPTVPGILDSSGTLGCPTTVKEQGYTFSEFYLCESSLGSPNSCTGGYETSNNTIPITVTGGSLIEIAVHLTDWDHQSGDDPVCNVSTWVGPESIYGWMEHTESGYMAQGDNDNASCSVQFLIRPRSD
ncbi:MAG: hypothetical protein JXA25_16850 [Anaerolineales bacterium]|nr:hypothetical protein [Anaerolineales bacterium]